MRRLLAVLGRDVSRSLSPKIHAAAAAELGVDVAYVPVSTDDVDRAVEALRALGALGANVTQPYKHRALALATRASPLAAEIGAANMLSFDDGEIAADNTDAPALLELLQRERPDALESVVVLGAGGAARATVWALVHAGAGAIAVLARAPTRVAIGGVEVGPLTRRAATLVISTLPGADDVADRAIACVAAPRLLDLAYVDRSTATPLVRRARALGISADDGLALLVEQGARSFSAWTGAPLDAVRRAMTRGL